MHARLKCIQIQNQKYIALHRIAPNHTQLVIFKKKQATHYYEKRIMQNTTEHNDLATETRSDNKEKNA